MKPIEKLKEKIQELEDEGTANGLRPLSFTRMATRRCGRKHYTSDIFNAEFMRGLYEALNWTSEKPREEWEIKEMYDSSDDMAMTTDNIKEKYKAIGERNGFAMALNWEVNPKRR
jgi:hypothetical protein